MEKTNSNAVILTYKDEIMKLKKYKNLYEDARIRLQNMERLSIII